MLGIFNFVPKGLYRIVFALYCFFELSEHVKGQLSMNSGDREIYNLMHGRSNVLLDYSDYIQKHPEDNWQGFDRIQSVYISNKYETPVTTWAHTNEYGDNRITALYN